MGKEKKQGKGLKIFAIILMIISLALIGGGVYFSLNTKEEPITEEPEEIIEPTPEELDINSDEVKKIFSNLAFDKTLNQLVDEKIKDYYFTKEEINDDLKLFIGLIALDKVANYNKDVNNVVEVETSEIESQILSIFEEGRSDNTYFDIKLGDGITASWNSETNKYVISSIPTEIPALSKYYGELNSAVKLDNTITLTLKTYYASLEDVDNDPATPNVYNLYKDATKLEKISANETGYTELPKISDSGIELDKFQDYEFTFTINEDGSYKFISFIKK